VAAGFFIPHLAIRQDDDYIAFLRQARRRASEVHLPFFLTLDGIGGKALPVVDVEDVNLFVRQYVGLGQQLAVNSHTTFVI
jgi:hypothetical protein